MPVEVVSVTLPLLAPTGTLALIELPLVFTAVPATPLNLTELALPRLLPVMVTTVPTPPLLGEKEEMLPAVPPPLPTL